MPLTCTVRYVPLSVFENVNPGVNWDHESTILHRYTPGISTPGILYLRRIPSQLQPRTEGEVSYAGAIEQGCLELLLILLLRAPAPQSTIRRATSVT